MDVLSSLPVEVARKVLRYLPAGDLAVCSKVSRLWRSLVDCPLLWRRRCHESGWKDIEFVLNRRTHRPTDVLQETESPLWILNDWYLNYRVHYLLPVNWEKNDSMVYLLSPYGCQVTTFSCDEHFLAIGHSDGTVSLLVVWRLPEPIGTLRCTLSGFPVLGIAVCGNRLVVLQSKLLQMYHFGDDGSYRLVDAKSFEMGFAMVEVFQRYEGEVETFGEWYSKGLGADRYTKERMSYIVNFQIFQGILYVAVRDYEMIYGWSLENGKRIHTIHIPSRTCKLRDIAIHNGFIYIIYASRNIRHITTYDIENTKFIYEITTPECKTQKLLIGNYLIGVAISGPGPTTPGIIKVWDKTNGKDLASRQTGFLTFKTVAEIYDLIAYGDCRTVYLWEPKNDFILKALSFGEVVSYIMPCPFRFLLIIGTSSSWIWDWLMGAQLYRVFPQLVKSADYRGLVYADVTMMLLKIDTSVVEMITFC